MILDQKKLPRKRSWAWSICGLYLVKGNKAAKVCLKKLYAWYVYQKPVKKSSIKPVKAYKGWSNSLRKLTKHLHMYQKLRRALWQLKKQTYSKKTKIPLKTQTHTPSGHFSRGEARLHRSHSSRDAGESCALEGGDWCFYGVFPWVFLGFFLFLYMVFFLGLLFLLCFYWVFPLRFVFLAFS